MVERCSGTAERTEKWIKPLVAQGETVQEDIKNAAEFFKKQIRALTQEEITEYIKKQRAGYDEEYSRFLEHYEKECCCLCEKPLKTISTSEPCIHWLLRRCKFKKRDFKKIIDKYEYHQISAFLRWVANAEGGVKNINNLKDESTDKKVFEVTIKWKNIEWTLDCSKNDFSGHRGTNSYFPHWHFQMRIGGQQFINFSDYHIKLSKDDQLKLMLQSDPDSGFMNTFGPGGQGMQECMDGIAKDPEKFLQDIQSVEDPEQGALHCNQ